MRMRDYSSHRRYSDDCDDDDDYKGCDNLSSQPSMRKRKSSGIPDYPSRRPSEDRTRYRSPNRCHSKRRRRYRTPTNRYPERRGRYASRLPRERMRRRRSYYAPGHRHASRHSLDARTSCDRQPASRQTERRDNHPSEEPSSSTCDFTSIVQTTRDEDIFSYISSNFCFGTPMKTHIDSTTHQDDDLVTFPGFVSDDIVMEILSRLPAKSLMRFKSVCKHWSSFIKHDRRFADLHYTYNCLKSRPNLICITGINPRQQQVYTHGDKQQEEEEDDEQQLEYRIDGYKFPQQILSAEIGDETIMNKVIMTDDKWFAYEYLLGLVDGLACFLDWDEDDVRLYNVSTREASPWIKSTLLSEERDKLKSKDTSIRREAIYRFGFDPENKEHKVFCFCRSSDRTKPSRIAECPDYTSCEVLAVGRDAKWRRISVVPNENNKIKINKVFPSYDVQRRSVYGNGTIYWRNKNRCLDVGSVDPDVIVALDVGSEKFRVIPIPKFILDEDHVYNGHSALFMLRGRVTVVNLLSDNIVKLWMLDDGAEDKKLENCQGTCDRNWISETIALPYSHYPRYVEFHGVGDQLLLSVYSEDHSLYRKFAFLHIYDSRRKTFKKIEIDGLSSVPFFCGTSIITTSTGSLYTVQPQQDKGQHSAVS